jgi:hypothetical protein
MIKGMHDELPIYNNGIGLNNVGRIGWNVITPNEYQMFFLLMAQIKCC